MPLLPKKFPALVAKPIAPFFVAALVVGYGINSLQNAMMNSEEFKNDPRNPNAGKQSGKH
ncbi:hypothetical protein H112_08441 [Trichophyton rubrum D6]|uniref:Mitochondrial F1F0 ATP synthase subunit Atp18 n=3 Tax=Trichophyton TaxID=5550 RepID=F2SEF6_TRIRC|nr:F1F0 ATP synthase subunit i [Trichophyton rubrum CBS 118892]EZF10231.1 hypothetical protein H100_08464 [Trichophyton rubrum MR850]EZF37122.1 hypothetical protein H102_08423 [Trichophyton rubrum CBS 100081]EZF47685.1 hypothetical protein H103_08446 [Trichophyton rubrum CBS 288.86]EZF58474.1 hypothetical protein H104_08398 [Trichophyton rubrum CBS 289.86]EZF69043.1 hypothetical protein H105_08451 [Trichophyton soudanense CBS 452.61]EZF79693.1 hypothetical protein H110_08448 [Trichophyton rub